MFSLSDISKSPRKGTYIFRAGLSDSARVSTNQIACFIVVITYYYVNEANQELTAGTVLSGDDSSFGDICVGVL